MFRGRISKLQQSLKQNSLEALLVSNFYNVLYLTGFKTLAPEEREAFVLLTRDKVYLMTDGRYLHKSEKFDLRLIETGRGLIYHLQTIIQKDNLSKIGFEAEDLKFGEYEKLKTALAQISLVPTERLVVKLRETKDQEEAEKVKKACVIGDQCLQEVLKSIKPQITEKELAFLLESWLKRKGYALAFDPIVAVNQNSSVPHYNTQEGKGRITQNSLILIDFGVKYQNYLSDITRIIFYGTPDSQALNIYNKLLNVQQLTIAKLEKIKEAKTIDLYCRSLISQHGLPNFPHSTGHGLGLEIHEFPKIASIPDEVVVPGNIFTIEPGVYLPNQFGVRIEDTIWLNLKGEIEILTQFPKTPLIIK